MVLYVYWAESRKTYQEELNELYECSLQQAVLTFYMQNWKLIC